MTDTQKNEMVRRQFNDQAENYACWDVSGNADYLAGYSDFCRIDTQDELLDVACGTGDFSLFCAPKVKRVVGIDISEGMIAIAKEKLAKQQVGTVEFRIGDVESLPFRDNEFTIVVCRSAFHHMFGYKQVFEEMLRCCQVGGRVSVLDIMAYENEHVNSYFEQFEFLVDMSHYEALSKKSLCELYTEYAVPVLRTFKVEVELNLKEYLSHAKQTTEDCKRIIDLVREGLKDPQVSEYLRMGSGENLEFFFKRNVFLIIGEKK
jgi:ubiquinone/menaquinone biosynthesis C-methylase UbiE